MKNNKHTPHYFGTYMWKKDRDRMKKKKKNLKKEEMMNMINVMLEKKSRYIKWLFCS